MECACVCVCMNMYIHIHTYICISCIYRSLFTFICLFLHGLVCLRIDVLFLCVCLCVRLCVCQTKQPDVLSELVLFLRSIS